jgi:hypothetical protein
MYEPVGFDHEAHRRIGQAGGERRGRVRANVAGVAVAVFASRREEAQPLHLDGVRAGGNLGEHHQGRAAPHRLAHPVDAKVQDLPGAARTHPVL